MANYLLPQASQMNDMLLMILGEEAKVTGEEPLSDGEVRHAAIYVDGDGNEVAHCIVDQQMAAGLGCALSMIPPAGAEDMVASDELTEVVQDNLYEVMNMLSSLYMNDSSKHLKLTKVESVKDSGSLSQLTDAQINGFALDIGKYGSGKIGFIAT